LKKAKNKPIKYFLFEEEGIQLIKNYFKQDEKLVNEYEEAKKCFP